MADSSSLGENDIPENLSVDTLNLDLEELDDAEYDIPPIDFTPTLESILNDIDDHGSLSEDDASGNHFLHPGEAFETWSMGSIGGRSRTSSERRTIRSSSRSGGASTPLRAGSILRHVILKAISSQVSSASERVGVGLPTAIAVRTMFAVGTSHGLVLVFDTAQTLRWCLGSTDQDQGSVSALSFNPDCSRLLVGYARGLILMYDVTSGKLLRTMLDAHPPGTAVLHVKFTDVPTIALCCDSGGSVFELNFKRLMGVRSCTTKCLFSGSRGEVCTMEPLLLNSLPNHPLQGSLIIALATLSKVIVLSIRPRMKVLFTHQLRADPATLPLLAWQFVIIQIADDSRVVDPVLAFARESTVHFFQVVVDSWAIRLRPLQRIVLPFVMQSLHWLNPRTLAALDTREQLHLVDVRSQLVLEVTDLASAGLVYGSSHFKGLATGGNVSEALALAGERACYNSILSFGSQMLVLGTKSVHVLSVRTWSERLDHLLRKKQHLDALALGLAIYQERAKAVVGLKGSHSKRRAIVKEKVLSILKLYIDEALCRAPSVSESLYRQAVPACMQYSVELGALDVLFGQLWEAVSVDRIARGIFLESLEPLILSESLKDVPPAIVQEFVTHYKEAGKFQALEACVVRLDVSLLDLNQLLPLCWLHGLYDAIIYMYTRGMADYTGPLQELLPTLQSALATGKQLTDKLITLGNKLLVYISCCLAGRGYPLGDIAPDQVAKVKSSVFQCVTSLHSVNAADTEPAYPYLRTLLNFDTREFLNVLALAFEEPEFTSELGLRQKQRFVDVLLQLVVPEEGFTASQVGALLTFLARQLAHKGGLQVDTCLFKRVVDFLTQPGAARGQHEERQQALLELMAAGGLQNYEPDQLLAAAEHAGFHRVREVLLAQRGDIHLVLDCYLQDQPRRPQVFPFLAGVLAPQDSIDLGKRQLLLDAIEENLKELVELDPQQTAFIVRENLWHKLDSILEGLSPSRLQYRLLKELFILQDEQSSDAETPDAALSERFIELMCEHEPERVCDFLRTSQIYRQDVALEIVRRWNLMDAAAFLLEQEGNYKDAFNLLLIRLEKRMENLQEEELKGCVEYDYALSTMQQCVNGLLRLCQAGSAVMNAADRQESLWLPLLQSLLKAHSISRSEVKPLLQQCLMAMSGFVNLPDVVQLVLQDQAYSGATFGEIRDLMMGMLSNCSYEQLLLECTSRLLSADLHECLAVEMSLAARGFGPRAVRGSPACSHCNDMLLTAAEEDAAVIFRCGHSFHRTCLDEPLTEEPLQCTRCDLQTRCAA